MPSFLSKVGLFSSRKKTEPGPPPATSSSFKAKTRPSVSSSLIDNQKFESISAPTSPAAAEFAEHAQEKAKSPGKDKGKESAKGSFFRPKSPRLSAHKKEETTKDIPQLSLNLAGLQENGNTDTSLDAALGLRNDAPNLLDWRALGEKRLTPEETLTLVQACAHIVKARGLETLGIMHPHWHSSSTEDQRRILSYFFDSITRPSTSHFQTSPFTSELRHCHTPHDPAAVLRWGVRHFDNGGKPFGNAKAGSSGQWDWYKGFSEAERSNSFPVNGFSQELVPLLPESSNKLLHTILDLTASLASQSEMNGISGSKLSKMLGYWLLGSRDQHESQWSSFYNDWNAAGRIMEHIFFAYLRDTKIHPKPPPRLLELIHSYPFGSSDDMFISRPRFSTHTYEALYIQVDIQRKRGRDKRTYTSYDLVSQALSADMVSDPKAKEELIAFWKSVQQIAKPSVLHVSGSAENGHAAVDESQQLPAVILTNVFAEESVRLLQLHSNRESEDPLTPTTLLTSELAFFRSHRRSISLDEGTPLKRQDSVTTTKPQSLRKAPNPASSPISTGLGTDWASFSTSGFFDGQDAVGSNLAATLLDNDVEVSKPTPAVVKRLSIKRKAPQSESPADSIAETAIPVVPSDKLSILSCELTSIDEAFVDFWSDALLDPVSKKWPLFAVCQLKQSNAMQHDQKSIVWLIFEGKHSEEPPPPPSRPASPTLSMKSLKKMTPISRQESTVSKSASTTGKSRRLFGLFGSSSKGMKHGKIASGASSRIGEMGEVLPEEPAKPTENVKGAKQGADVAPSTSPAKQVDAPAPTTAAAAAAPSKEEEKAKADAPKAVEPERKVEPSHEPLTAIEENTPAPAAIVSAKTEHLDAPSKPAEMTRHASGSRFVERGFTDDLTDAPDKRLGDRQDIITAPAVGATAVAAAVDRHEIREEAEDGKPKSEEYTPASGNGHVAEPFAGSSAPVQTESEIATAEKESINESPVQQPVAPQQAAPEPEVSESKELPVSAEEESSAAVPDASKAFQDAPSAFMADSHALSDAIPEAVAEPSLAEGEHLNGPVAEDQAPNEVPVDLASPAHEPAVSDAQPQVPVEDLAKPADITYNPDGVAESGNDLPAAEERNAIEEPVHEVVTEEAGSQSEHLEAEPAAEEPAIAQNQSVTESAVTEGVAPADIERSEPVAEEAAPEPTIQESHLPDEEGTGVPVMTEDEQAPIPADELSPEPVSTQEASEIPQETLAEPSFQSETETSGVDSAEAPVAVHESVKGPEDEIHHAGEEHEPDVVSPVEASSHDEQEAVPAAVEPQESVEQVIPAARETSHDIEPPPAHGDSGETPAVEPTPAEERTADAPHIPTETAISDETHHTQENAESEHSRGDEPKEQFSAAEPSDSMPGTDLANASEEPSALGSIGDTLTSFGSTIRETVNDTLAPLIQTEEKPVFEGVESEEHPASATDGAEANVQEDSTSEAPAESEKEKESAVEQQ